MHCPGNLPRGALLAHVAVLSEPTSTFITLTHDRKEGNKDANPYLQPDIREEFIFEVMHRVAYSRTPRVTRISGMDEEGERKGGSSLRHFA